MTHPAEPRPHTRVRPRPRPLTVPVQNFGINNPVITSPVRLCGWSLAASFSSPAAISASSQGTAAAADTLVCNGFSGLSSVTVDPAGAWPAGANVVTITNISGGPIIKQIPGGTTQPVTFLFSPTSGVTGTVNVTVPAMVGGPAYTITAVGVAQLAAGNEEYVLGNILDGGQPVGVFSIVGGQSDSKWISDEGIYVGSNLALQMLSGSVSGVLWILDNWHGGDN